MVILLLLLREGEWAELEEEGVEDQRRARP